MQEIVKDRIKFIDSHPQHSVTHDIVLFGNYIFTLVRNLIGKVLKCVIVCEIAKWWKRKQSVK